MVLSFHRCRRRPARHLGLARGHERALGPSWCSLPTWGQHSYMYVGCMLDPAVGACRSSPGSPCRATVCRPARLLYTVNQHGNITMHYSMKNYSFFVASAGCVCLNMHWGQGSNHATEIGHVIYEIGLLRSYLL